MKDNSYLKSFLFFFIFSLTAIVLSACGGGTNGDDDTIQKKVNISGRVTGSGPIAEVKVSTSNISTQTDINGAYLLQDVPVPANKRIVLTYEKSGFGTYQRSLIAEGGETYAVEAKLLNYQLSETVTNGTQAQTLTSTDNAGTLVSLTLDTGSLSENNVTVNIATGDPTTDEGRAVFPGDYMAATTAGGEPDTPLESIAYTEITITDAQGKELSSLDKPATLKVRLPDIYQAGGTKAGTYDPAGDETKNSIEWWSYDESNGSWILEDADPGTAKLDKAAIIEDAGVLYAQAKVTHFSWWNADKPMTQHACLCVKVVDEDGNPIADALVIAEGATYEGRSTPKRTDSQGNACVTVKRTMEPTTPEKVKIYVEYGGVSFFYDVTDADEGDITNDLIFTPTEQGSTITIPTTGTCTNLKNNIVASFEGTVSGTITYEGGSVASGFTLHSNYGSTATTDAQGKYTIKTPLDTEVMLFAPGLTSKTVTTTQAAPDKILDFVISNQAPIINSLTRNPTGLIANGGAVTLTAQASDPEGDPISYSWSVNGSGTLNQTNGPQVIWTAPGSGVSDDQITLTVTDSKNKTSTQSITISWGGSIGGSSFSLTIMNNSIDKQPVPGVTVAIYSNDNQSIQSTKTTAQNGIADFGDIGRSRSSVTIAWSSAAFQNQIDTLVDIPVGNYVYYVNDDFETACGTTGTSININVPGLTGTSYGIVQPTFTYIANTNPTSAAYICRQHLQTDNKLTLLVNAYEGFPTYTPLKYGFLTDQTLAAGNTYTIDLADNQVGRLPNSIQISTAGGIANVANIWAARKRVLYTLGTNSAITEQTSSIMTANMFPADFYNVNAIKMFGTEFNSPSVSTNKRYGTLPLSVQLTLPDYTFSATSYNEASNTFSWTLTGTTPRDNFNLTLSAGLSELDKTTWSVFLPGTASSWKTMPLPEPASSWIDISALKNNISTAELEVVDYDSVTGADEVIEFFATGGSFFDPGVIGQQQMGTAYIQVAPLLVKPNKKSSTAPLEKTQKSPFSPTGAINGFVRR